MDQPMLSIKKYRINITNAVALDEWRNNCAYDSRDPMLKKTPISYSVLSRAVRKELLQNHDQYSLYKKAFDLQEQILFGVHRLPDEMLSSGYPATEGAGNALLRHKRDILP